MTTSSTLHTAPEATVPPLVGEHWIETLNDGSHVLVRPIRPEDRERESEFIERLSPESRHFRFLGEMRGASPALLDQLVNVDNQKDMAFVALVHDNSVLREVGVSRYSTSGDDTHCECAVTVADDWQHRGLGVVLMRHLIDVARRHGFRQMFSMDAASNEPMRDLANYLGFDRKRDPQDATQVIHTLDLLKGNNNE
ncbi:MAG TPA: GNAT family N-acetyltransferase [Rhodanobacter sp.]|jgi:GNAT superfamily N-acetyltransferase|nr:GNAT family N-acetyltransferase [Rhodanobacter sp.]